MTDSSPSLAEQDARIARLGEAALRIMAGEVTPATVEKGQQLVAQAGDTYPWESVTDAMVGQPVDPNELVNRGIRAQRDWLARGGGALGIPAGPIQRAVSREAANGRRKASAGPSLQAKRAVAVLIVRGGFYLVTAVLLGIGLVFLQRIDPAFDIYAFGRSVEGAFKSVFG